MKTHALITLFFLICMGTCLQVFSQTYQQHGYATFPTENGKYREIASRIRSYKEVPPNPPLLSYTDSTVTTYKNDQTNAVDKYINYQQKSSSGEWYVYSEEVFSYDTTDTHTSITVVNSIDITEGLNGLKNSEKSTMQRERASGHVEFIQDETWDETANAYKNSTRYEYAYDDQGRVIEEKLLMWIGTEWIANHSVKSTYDGNSKRLKTEIASSHDPMPPHNEFPYQKIEYTYNGENNILNEDSYSYVSSDQSWDPSGKTRYVYSGSRLDSVLIENSYTAGDGSKNFFLSNEWTLTYNAENELTEQVLRAAGGALIPIKENSRYTHTYANGDLKTTLRESWNSSDNVWQNLSRYEYTFNNGGYITKYIEDEWSTDNSVWTAKENNSHYYQENTNGYTDVYEIEAPDNDPSSSINELDNVSIDIFPNPAQNELSVRYDATEDATFTIVSVEGQLAKTGELRQGVDNKISLSNIPSGHYILMINGSTISAKRHFVKYE